jgi:hypothetical protein
MVELVPRPADRAATYVVHVGDLRIELGGDFDADVLRRLVQVVATC